MSVEETTRDRAGETAKGTTGQPAYFVRFALGQRIEHIVLMVTFTALAVTGLAQRYYTAGWAEWIILNLGGIAYARLVHRAFALLFVMSMVYHFSYIGYVLLVRHARASMVPTLKDFRDVVAVVRYSFGFTGARPEFGRFDYRQKFEYWGLMFGSAIIVITGFFLAFPEAVTRVLPGQVIAASVQFHGYEATLAVLTIVVWHLYDVIFKPGIFPADTSIFTGKISRKRMAEEHSLEYIDIIGQKGTGEMAGPPETRPLPETPTE